ncbi:unnamed protein product [Haemonchus placei]|uniref:Uncharacterized protein n=1 Tax=Haemonchus placei TaxID=6290 RepID=A0A3P7UZ61_HAEPC|nr:unnamed protein product [Haemonchus placei]
MSKHINKLALTLTVSSNRSHIVRFRKSTRYHRLSPKRKSQDAEAAALVGAMVVVEAVAEVAETGAATTMMSPSRMKRTTKRMAIGDQERAG